MWWILTYGTKEVVVMREGQERFRQLPQPLFDQTCDGVDGVILQTNILRTFTNTQPKHKQFQES